MKILTNKEYYILLENTKSLDYYKKENMNILLDIEQLYKNISILELQLKESKQEKEKNTDLKEILNKLSSIKINGLSYSDTGGTWKTDFTVSDNVLVYVDDILGGKVIKQEGVTCVVVSKDGNTRIGLTKQKPDKGFNYKLIREK